MPSLGLTNIVDNFLVDRAKNGNHRDNNHFHPSEWDGCHRKIAYQYYEAQGLIKTDVQSLKIDPQLERIFDNGHFVHDRWRTYLESTGALLGRWECMNWMAHSSRPAIFGLTSKIGMLKPSKCECGSDKFRYHEIGLFDDETWWGGHVDAILDVSVLKQKFSFIINQACQEEEYIIVDFKSINPYGFKDLDEPHPEHLTQMNIYLYLTGLRLGKFVYEDKGSQSVKEFDVVRNDTLLSVKKDEAKILKHLVTHTNILGKRVLPHRAYNSRGHKKCLSCKFRGHCWDKSK